LKIIWQETSQFFWTGFSKLSVTDWLQKHAAVSEEDFLGTASQSVHGLLGRTVHIAYHLGQAKLSERAEPLEHELKAGRRYVTEQL